MNSGSVSKSSYFVYSFNKLIHVEYSACFVVESRKNHISVMSRFYGLGGGNNGVARFGVKVGHSVNGVGMVHVDASEASRNSSILLYFGLSVGFLDP